MHTLSLEDFSYGDVNITAYRIVDPERPEVEAIVRQWNSLISVDNFNSRSHMYGSSYYYGNDQGYMPSVRNGNKNVMPYTNPALVPESEQKMMKVSNKNLKNFLLNKFIYNFQSIKVFTILVF